MSTIISGCSPDYGQFDAVTLDRSGSFELDMSPDEAFPLFTAPGERLWAPGWEPFILSGDGFEEGTVWITTAHGQTTYWHVATYNPTDRHARYFRVTPDANTGTVDVRVLASDAGGATVYVTYQLTGLSEAGNKSVQDTLGEAEYSDMMEHWHSAINQNREQIDAHYGRQSG